MKVATRMPRLTELDLRMIIPARLIAKPVRALLSSLPALKTIIFPNCHTTSAVLSTLSHLPHLHPVQFECFPFRPVPFQPKRGVHLSYPIPLARPDTGAFQTLSDLSLTASLQEVQHLRARNEPHELVHRLQGVQGVRAFLGCVGGGVPVVEGAFIWICCGWISRGSVWPVRELHDRVAHPWIRSNLSFLALISCEYPPSPPVSQLT